MPFQGNDEPCNLNVIEPPEKALLMRDRDARPLGPPKAAVAGRITNARGARLAGLSPQQFKRLKTRVHQFGDPGIGLERISQGASCVNLSFVVRDEDADRSVRLPHRGLGLGVDESAPGDVPRRAATPRRAGSRTVRGPTGALFGAARRA